MPLRFRASCFSPITRLRDLASPRTVTLSALPGIAADRDNVSEYNE
jgi:hypothetical protein